MQKNPLIPLLQRIYHQQPESNEAIISRACADKEFSKLWLYHALGSSATAQELAVVLSIVCTHQLHDDLSILSSIWQPEQERVTEADTQLFLRYTTCYGLSGAVDATLVALWLRLNNLAPDLSLHHPVPEIALGRLQATRLAESLIECASSMMIKAGLYGPKESGLYLDAIRNNDQAMIALPPAEPYSVSLQRMLSMQLQLAVHHAEPLIIYRYLPGQEYKWHCDFVSATNTATQQELALFGQRSDTVILYLSDNCSGGATCFKTWNVQIQPEANAFIHFNNLKHDGSINPDSVHCGAPVLEGVKWIATTWYRTKPMWHRCGLLDHQKE